MNDIIFSFENIERLLAQYFFPFSRIAAVVMSMSIIGNRTIPAQIKLLLALTLTIVSAPFVEIIPDVSLLSLSSALIIIEQIIIGVGIGFITKLLFETFILGAQIIAMQTGLGFASMIDPTNGLQVPVLSQFYLLLVTLMFLAIDGHLVVIELMINSLNTLPIGESIFQLRSLKIIVDWTSIMFAAALMMCLAAVLSLLMINLAFGVITRAAPQLNIFVIGFPMTLLAGLLIVWITLEGFSFHFEQQTLRATHVMCLFINKAC
ncbi:MAG: flagellar biosynthetic protein FliR [Pseudomonadota bacterium]